MVEIKRSKAGFRVIYKAANGEPLAVSETLESLANAKKNIKALANIFGTGAAVAVFYNGKLLYV